MKDETVQFVCADAKCKNETFLVVVNFETKFFRLLCSKCEKMLYELKTNPEMTLGFEKDYIEQELEKN